MEPFERELLELICKTCNLDDVEMDTFVSTEPLLGPTSTLGLDSLDALAPTTLILARSAILRVPLMMHPWPTAIAPVNRVIPRIEIDQE